MKCFFYFLISLFLINTSNAGVIIGGTRVIYNEGKKDVNISVENPDDIPYLIQAWIDNIDEKKQSSFTITPPLFRLNSNNSNTLRILLTEESLPSDRESLFWLNIKTIPATEKIENALQIAFKTQMKLIYRPKILKNISFNDEQQKLEWSKSGNKISIKNPTPYFINFQMIKFNGQSVNDVSYVAPFSTRSFDINNEEKNGTINWEIINDYGGTVELSEKKI